MTPKQQAEALRVEYDHIIPTENIDDDVRQGLITECSLIVVRTILAVPNLPDQDFWQCVHDELDKWI